MKEHLKITKQIYPDYRMKIIKQFCDGDYVISEFIMEGIHKGELLGQSLFEVWQGLCLAIYEIAGY